MKKLFLLLAVAILTTVVCHAEQFVNLTPAPANRTVGTGVFRIPAGMKITAQGLTPEMQSEVTKFISDFNKSTGLGIGEGKNGRMTVRLNKEIATEGYNLDVTAKGIVLEASSPAGLFYGLQTIKKILPANVMAGTNYPRQKSYELPVVSIQDRPAYGYRGFMLDVSRHFFTADEIKRMLDVMSYYKLNRFHWHLTDDQGWRLPMDKYPLLTTVGATAPDVVITDYRAKKQYKAGKPYGPYSYTKEEIKDIVDYAKKLHIEVVPEVDMPGHFVAAMVAYPELSCDPKADRKVWDHGGVSRDVLNVANPAAVKLGEDVIDQLAELFPYPYIHIGGDECPTVAWENNADCRALMEKEGMKNPRQLQNRFIKQMADRAAKHGKKLYVWNEALTEEGADSAMLKNIDATVFCWVGVPQAVKKATSNGLGAIFTPIGPYYINRRQSRDAAPGAGPGNDDVKRTYTTVPFTTAVGSKDNCLGVQGTFWTEHVSDADYMEYLALPRLIAIAEAGWTPQEKKDFADFQKRMTADAQLLDLGGYKYTRLYMLQPVGSSTGPDSPGRE
ncbi:MAG: beta-N-acetylhexosaminidase [Muribaculaceae bacterium]|nr:beta-N-acetylhexosaminidase [Muribaculaceae bacterium]